MILRKQFLTFLLLFSVSLTSFSQDKEPTEKEKGMMYNLFYAVGKKFTKSSSEFFKTKKLEDSKKLRSCPISENQILNAISYMEKNATLQVNEKGFMGAGMEFNSSFPKAIRIENPGELFEIKILENNLTNSGNEKVQIKKYTSKYFKYASQDHDPEIDWQSEEDYIFIKATNHFKNKDQLKLPFSGMMKYEISVLTGFEQKKVSKKDIGKTITIGENEYVLVDFYDNKVVLSPPEGKSNKLQRGIKIINLDASGENEYVPYSGMELMELRKKDERYKNASSSTSTSNYTFNKDMYEYFKNNPKATKEEFINSFPFDKVKNRRDQQNYHIYETYAAIEHSVILYFPVYGIQKTITVKL